jgi:hypothetical protein
MLCRKKQKLVVKSHQEIKIYYFSLFSTPEQKHKNFTHSPLSRTRKIGLKIFVAYFKCILRRIKSKANQRKIIMHVKL